MEEDIRMSRLTLNAVTKRYGAKTVIEPLSLDVPDGAFVALLGPSGCGKTTLLRMVAGLEDPDSGEIRLGNRVVFASGAGVNLPPEERGIGMVFQSYAVWPHMTVSDNVAYPLRVRRRQAQIEPAERDRRVREALELVRMGEYAGRFPHQLSGGQQQRVALARGLAMKPPVLLLDEPLSNLDARLRAEMRREIRDLHRRLGITLMYVTHDQREAFEMSTHVVVLNEGRIAQQGPPEEVRANPAPGFVAEFLALG
jgi:ABC-type Fe3+/spermidine/putrescine transport system ATPase subunit